MSQELNKQITAKQQELATLTASLKAKQGEWDDQKRQIASDTEITIAASKKAIADATVAAKQELSDLHAQVKEGGEVFFKQRDEQERYYSKVKAEIVDLEHTKKVLLQTNADLRADNQTLESTITVYKADVLSLEAEKTQLQEQVGDLTGQEVVLLDSIGNLTTSLQDARADLERLEIEFATQQQKYDNELSILSQKRDQLAFEIADMDKHNDVVRQNLATWSAKLEEHDKNLRIREAKVDEQQKAIVRNHNLLSL